MTHHPDPLADAEREAGRTIDGRPVDKDEEKGGPRNSARDRLLKVASAAAVWRCPDGVAHATVPVDGHVEHWPVGSRGFRDWLLRSFGATYTVEVDGKEQPAAANKQAIADALDFVAARVLGADVPAHEPALRSVMHEGKLYIDLGTKDWRAVEVTGDGWTIIKNAPVPILRTRRTRPLPLPERDGSINKLRSFLPVAARELPLLVMWLLAAVWPGATFPMLALSGEHGAGKSTATRVLRRLVDPAGGDLLQPPGTDRDLVAAARHNRVLAFDNLSSLRPDLADSLCRLATGAEIGGRGMYTDHDLATFAAARPIILNGIPDLATRGDLASRSVAITFEPLAHRMDEAAFWAAFGAAAPGIFGALLDGLAMAIRDLPGTATPQGHRMADFAKLAAAAAPAFGWPADQVLEQLHANAREQAAKLAEGDLVAVAVSAVFGTSACWEGTMGGLYDAAKVQLDDDARRSPDWPKGARYFGERVRRAAPALRVVGIAVSIRSKDGRTLVTLEQKKASPTSPTSAPSTTCASASVEVGEGAESGRSGRAAPCSQADTGVPWEGDL